ncbi:MAG: 16S rRNA (cytidine(1402)-2'-O)-methyltransferase [Proteobacteria bacterium]|nr:MAG: 16S rRNA (cytidine(1402)-2'-O)-methyltransferase [Pseudomonadota bacterium]
MPTPQPVNQASPRRRTFLLGDQGLETKPIAPGLYVVATPIGNLRDITLRALETLAAADLIACEDTRVTRKLTEHFSIATPLTPYHDHNAATVRPQLLARLARGQSIALVSDAGTPLVSDPGYKLVRAAQADGHPVVSVPGASAVLAALTVAGLPTDRFFFAGFLPTKPSARDERIAEFAVLPASVVLFEAGSRVAETLALLMERLGAREAVVCRELTKLHEDVRRGDLAELTAHWQAGGETRGEFVVVIAPAVDTPAGEAEVDAMLRRALAGASVKEAVAAVAAATGQPRRNVYRRALALKGDAP